MVIHRPCHTEHAEDGTDNTPPTLPGCWMQASWLPKGNPSHSQGKRVPSPAFGAIGADVFTDISLVRYTNEAGEATYPTPALLGEFIIVISSHSMSLCSHQNYGFSTVFFNQQSSSMKSHHSEMSGAMWSHSVSRVSPASFQEPTKTASLCPPCPLRGTKPGRAGAGAAWRCRS